MYFFVLHPNKVDPDTGEILTLEPKRSNHSDPQIKKQNFSLKIIISY